MKELIRIFIFLLFNAIFMIADVYAFEMPQTDSGKDKNGDLIVAKTLALRCGLSSKKTELSSDCIDRLAYDFRSGKVAGGIFDSYSAERKAILNEYAAAYIYKAMEQLIAASGYESRINKLTCANPTGDGCAAAPKDTRAEIENNNKLATDNAAILLDAIRLRASELNMYSVSNVLYNIVPVKEVDLSNTSLASAP